LKGNVSNKKYITSNEVTCIKLLIASGPVPRRPATTDMVAKRLVHGALGVRSVKTPEQREAEKELLKQARGTVTLIFCIADVIILTGIITEQRHAQRLNTANREKDIANAFDE
jgi:hypothetical protein